MKTISVRIVLTWMAITLLFTACGGGGSSVSGSTYTLSGRVQKGPFAVGSQISVNELNTGLNPSGNVYNVQTTDNLGNFAVSSQIGSNLVEIVGTGFYMDELTGQLAASQIQIRAIADLSVNDNPTINVLTTLQEQRLKTLFSQGQTYTAASTQSRNEVLAAFGIDSTKVNSLSDLYSMRINGGSDADAVLLATSVILSKMAINAAVAHGTTQSAELSNYVNTIAADIANTGAITDTAIIAARHLAETQIDMAAVRTNLETYYANRGVNIVAPKFEEWVDQSGSGILPQRLMPVAGLLFTDITGAAPGQLITSNPITVTGAGAGIVVPVKVSNGTTIIKNNAAVSGRDSTAQDGDILAVRITSPGYGLTISSMISVGSSSAVWNVTSQPLGGVITGLTGTGLVLQNNGGDNITIPDGSLSFAFPSPVAIGDNYNITVLNHPTSPLQACTVSNGTGTVGSETSNIAVVCDPVTYIALVGMNYDDYGIGHISTYSFNATSGALTNIGTISAPSVPSAIYSIAIDPTGRFAYAANYFADNISAYAINNATRGALTSLGTTTSGVSPSSIVVDPGGKFIYVLNSNSNNISCYSINADTGVLTSIDTITTIANPVSIAIEPAGKFIYVTNGGNSSAYSINATTGVLTSLGTYVLSGTSPWSIAVDPGGKFLYVTNISANNIAAYSIDVTTGALTHLGWIATGIQPSLLTIDPTGRFAYVSSTINYQRYISAYSINASTGLLTSLGSFIAGSSPYRLAFDPTGKFFYVLDSNGYISVFSINADTGLLTINGTIETDGFPLTIAFTRVQ